jgi:hypothetical protein
MGCRPPEDALTCGRKGGVYGRARLRTSAGGTRTETPACLGMRGSNWERLLGLGRVPSHFRAPCAKVGGEPP